MQNTARKLENFEDQYEGERIFILGNGPSLNKTPLERLDTEYTLAMNRINLIYSDTEWRPSFYYYAQYPMQKLLPEDRNHIIQNADLGIQCFVYSAWSDILGNQDNITYFDRWLLSDYDGTPNPFHEADLDDVKEIPIEVLYHFWSDYVPYFIYHYHTMYGAVQMAVYMGFDEIYFLGCDLGLEYIDPHMIFDSALDPYEYKGGAIKYLREARNKGKLLQSVVNGIAMKSILFFENNKFMARVSPSDHFSSDYASFAGIYDGPAAADELRKGHVAAKRICDDKGIDVYNATIGGELEIYERVDLDDIL